MFSVYLVKTFGHATIQVEEMEARTWHSQRDLQALLGARTPRWFPSAPAAPPRTCDRSFSIPPRQPSPWKDLSSCPPLGKPPASLARDRTLPRVRRKLRGPIVCASTSPCRVQYRRGTKSGIKASPVRIFPRKTGRSNDQNTAAYRAQGGNHHGLLRDEG